MRRGFLGVTYALGLASLLCCLSAGAAAEGTPETSGAELPDAPRVMVGATAEITGIVRDLQGSPVAQATVTLVQENKAEQTVQTDGNGAYTLRGLAGGAYRLTITAAGFESAVTPEILLRSGDSHAEPDIRLPVATANITVQVNATEESIAQEQVHLQEQQRFLSVFPNFYTSYIWQAAPLNRRQKFGLAAHSIVDPVVFVATGAVAGLEQSRNTFPAYGHGAGGYAQRYAADYADEASARMFSSAIFPSLFHQDPRYFYVGSGSKKGRFVYAISRAVVTRGDNGRQQPNYSRILGVLASGALSNAYHLGQDRGVGLTLRNSSIAIGGNAADNVLREFVFRAFTPKVPGYANGKP